VDLTRASLLSRVRDTADHEAWRDFERTYRDLVLRYSARRGLQPMDAEDVFQRVLLKLLRALPRFTYDPARGRFRDYLYRAVRSAISDHAARLERTPAPVDSDMLELAGAAGPDAPALDSAWDQEWADHHYRLALATLRDTFDPRSLEMFERLLAGARVDAVALEYATTPGAVHKVKQRVRDRLKELIEQQVEEEDRV
jgi:RNA polymerase sigma factor (sigma-70 family)